jgi:hypothetical protein
MEDLIEAYMSVYDQGDELDEGFKKMDRAKIEDQAKRLGGGKGDILRDVADRMDTEAERKYSTSQARRNRAGAGSEYRKAQELRARDDAKADFEKYGLPESVDSYDVVLEYLMNEGYADTEQNAVIIMANMSEAWIDGILDEASVYGARKGTIRSVIAKGGTGIRYVAKGGDIVAGDESAQARAAAADRNRNERNRANVERFQQTAKKSIQTLNAKPGEDSGSYDSYYHGDDDTSGGKRHYSLSHTNRSDRTRRAKG